jgi:hypothetical protein
LLTKGRGKELKSLKRFGEMCVVTTKAKIQGKQNDRGTVCVFVGYPKSHSSDVHRLLNPKTYQVINSRDIIWLDKTQRQWMKSKNSLEKVEDDLFDSELEKDATKEQMKLPTKIDETAKSTKVLKEISKLMSWFNPDPTRFIEEQDLGSDLIVEKADVALNAVDLAEGPKTFEEAYFHPDAEQKMKWQEDISRNESKMCLEENSKIGVAKRSNMFKKQVGFSNGTEFFVHGYWPVGTAKYPELISKKVLRQ